MILLGDVPALRIAAPGQMAPLPRAQGFADAPVVSAEDIAEAARAASAAAGSDLVAVIDADVLPAPAAEAVMPERAFVEARLCLAYPSRGVITGLMVPRGLRLIPVERLRDGAPLPEPGLLVPQGVGDFTANDAPQRAFQAGFGLTAGQPLPPPGATAARARAALGASLGADALNGVWWVLGALHALLGRGSVQACWAEAAPLMSDQAAPARRIRELARLVRAETGLPVQALDRRQSRAIKAMLSPWAPPGMWQDFIRDAGDLGAQGAAVSDRYSRAAAMIWPSDS
ncbi:hypothetical protein [Rhodovulum euryhalinum]|uniref:Uncharacterized protein n=1 Tax=Rhodovulum euryhalinum TaxID=35805 RepID=A0A4V2SAK6_9RHOB|nr:hypothetical protein [Rhodovulum euryhalinum]TCO72040.1 hypothetical protein EV655_105146 [Rhodovulum euryhalinum]